LAYANAFEFGPRDFDAGEILPFSPLISSQSDLGRRADSRWALPQISSFFNIFCQREIFEMRGPTNVKFCMMISTRLNFIMPVQNFESLPSKNFRGQKHAKFGPISVDFEVWQRISPNQIKVFKIGE